MRSLLLKGCDVRAFFGLNPSPAGCLSSWVISTPLEALKRDQFTTLSELWSSSPSVSSQLSPDPTVPSQGCLAHGCQMKISVSLSACSQSKQLLLKDLWPPVSCQCMAFRFLHSPAWPTLIANTAWMQVDSSFGKPSPPPSPIKRLLFLQDSLIYHFLRCFLLTPALITFPLCYLNSLV